MPCTGRAMHFGCGTDLFLEQLVLCAECVTAARTHDTEWPCRVESRRCIERREAAVLPLCGHLRRYACARPFSLRGTQCTPRLLFQGDEKRLQRPTKLSCCHNSGLCICHLTAHGVATPTDVHSDMYIDIDIDIGGPAARVHAAGREQREWAGGEVARFTRGCTDIAIARRGQDKLVGGLSAPLLRRPARSRSGSAPRLRRS